MAKASFRTIAGLTAAIQREFHEAMRDTKQKVETDLKENVAHFYKTPNPKTYDRTYTLRDESPKVSDIDFGGNWAGFHAEMDDGISYNTGTFSGTEVLYATEYGEYGVIGNPGYWQKTEDNIQKNIDESFGSHFNK